MNSVVFVHGLGSDPDCTWTAKNASSSESGYINWVVDFLPNDLPGDVKNGTRLFFYNYNTYWKRDAVKTRLARISLEFLGNLRNQIERETSVSQSLTNNVDSR